MEATIIQPARRRRLLGPGRATGVLGAIVVVGMLLACLLTVPYTMGRGSAGVDPDTGEPVRPVRRFEATDLAESMITSVTPDGPRFFCAPA